MPRGPAGHRVALPGTGRGVRLTRRGRVVVAVLLVVAVLMVVALAWLAGASTARAAGGAAPPGLVYRNMTAVVVRPGQTLWSIASRAQPTADPRVVVQEIMDVNALPSMVIQPGERLWVPRG